MGNKTAGIVTVGDELVSGDRVDTNSAFLSSELLALGVDVVFHVSVPDDVDAIAGLLRESAARVDWLIVTGGLGPTEDDVTRQALAAAAGDTLMVDETAGAAMRRRFAQRGVELTESNLGQARRPASFSMIVNPLGTAPGLTGRIGNATVFVMPGVPGEMKRMWADHVGPTIAREPGGESKCHTRWVHVVSRPESLVGKAIADLMPRGRDPVVGTLVRDLVVSVRVRSFSSEGAALVDKTADEIAARLGPYVFGRDETTLAQSLHERLRAAGQTVATAESCTGGLLGAMLTEPSGASDVYVGGFVTYSNRMKREFLDVTPETIEVHGAVSGLTANQMAVGALDQSGATFALAVTGIAGPGGGDARKPVGTVFIALGVLDEDGKPTAQVRRFRYVGDREMIRARSAISAMAMLHFHLVNDGEIPEMTFGEAIPGVETPADIAGESAVS